MNTVIIHPEPGFEKVIAQELLALADNPYQVEYVMWPAVGFRVPEWLYELFADDQTGNVRPASEIPGAVEFVTEVPAGAIEFPGIVEETVEPVKRKPGRPKKKVEGQ